MKVSEVIIPKEITLLIAFAVALNMLRVVLFDSWSLIYMLWNIFLAFVPFLISSTLVWHAHHGKVSRYEIIAGGLLWLVLFPNAPYMITDFIHVGESDAAPMWFDILIIFTSAWVGLQFAFYSLQNIEGLLRKRFKTVPVRIMLALVLGFASFGIYLGRFPRFNSWDILANPSELAAFIWRTLSGGSHTLEAFAFSVFFFCFLWVTYTAWKLSKKYAT